MNSIKDSIFYELIQELINPYNTSLWVELCMMVDVSRQLRKFMTDYPNASGIMIYREMFHLMQENETTLEHYYKAVKRTCASVLVKPFHQQVLKEFIRS